MASSDSGAAISPPRLRHDNAEPIEKPDIAEPTLANAEANDAIGPMDRMGESRSSSSKCRSTSWKSGESRGFRGR